MAAPLMQGFLIFMNLYTFIQKAGKRKNLSNHADYDDQKH